MNQHSVRYNRTVASPVSMIHEILEEKARILSDLLIAWKTKMLFIDHDRAVFFLFSSKS